MGLSIHYMIDPDLIPLDRDLRERRGSVIASMTSQEYKKRAVAWVGSHKGRDFLVDIVNKNYVFWYIWSKCIAASSAQH